MKRRRVALWNAAFGYATLASTLARNILLVPLYLKFVEFGEYGAWLATGGALVQLLVTDFGLGGVITQRVAVLTGGADHAALRATVIAGLVNAALLAVVLTAASGAIAVFLPATDGLARAQVDRVVQCFLIAIAANGLGVIGSAAMASLRGLQRAVISGAITLVADLAGIAMTVICLLADLGLYSLALALLLRSAITTVAGLAGLLPMVAQGAGFRWADSLALWRQAGRFFVTSIAMRLQTQANTVAVGIFLGPHAAGSYGLTVRAHETVLIILWQLNAAIGPVLAHLVGAGQRARLDTVVRGLLPMVAAVAAVGAGCTVALNQSFVNLWVGEHAFSGMAVTVLMGVALWSSAIASVGYEALIARGEFGFIARVYGGASVLHVAVLASLVHLGAWAAPFALCLSTLTWGSLLWVRVLTDMGSTRRERLAVAREPLLIAAAVAVATLAFHAWLPHVDSWKGFVAEAALMSASLVFLLLVLRPRLRATLHDEWRNTVRAVS